MRRQLNQANELAERIKKETGRNLVAVRVFSNTLLLYFDKGRCTFYSKEDLNWGSIGSLYFTTVNFKINNISKTLKSQYPALLDWTKDYVEGSIFAKIFLLIEYNTRYAL